MHSTTFPYFLIDPYFIAFYIYRTCSSPKINVLLIIYEPLALSTTQPLLDNDYLLQLRKPTGIITR